MEKVQEAIWEVQETTARVVLCLSFKGCTRIWTQKKNMMFLVYFFLLDTVREENKTNREETTLLQEDPESYLHVLVYF